MKKEVLSSRQAVCLLSLFLFGNSALFGVNGSAGRDAWASLLLAALCALVVTAVYGRILRLCGKQEFFSTLQCLFGQRIGRFLTLLFVWYAIHLSALLMRTLTEFGVENGYSSPPRHLVLIAFVLAGVYLARSGDSVLGRWAVIVFFVVLGISALTIAVSIKDMTVLNLFPLLRRPPLEVGRGAVRYLTFPFLECVVFLPLLSGRQGMGAGVFRGGLLWSAGILLAILLCNLLLLGEPMLQQVYFPSHNATMVINIGAFLTRLEEGISIFMYLSGLTKFAVCLLVASKGVGQLAGAAQPADLTAPVAMLCFALSMVVVNDLMELDSLVSSYPVYAAAFQLALPLLIWMVAEYRAKANTRTDSAHQPKAS